MSGPTPGEFHAAEGVEDWRALFFGVHGRFAADGWATAAAFVAALRAVPGLAALSPAVDLRADAVTVRLPDDVTGHLPATAVEVSRRVSALARDHGLRPDPAGLQVVQLTLDALVGADVIPFWRAVLGYDLVGDSDLVDPRWRSPVIWVQDMDAPRPQRNRVHVDVSVPHDQAEARVAAALAAGGRLVTDRFAPSWWTLADAEGNEVDVASWVGREG